MREFDLNGLRLAEYQGKLFELSFSETKYSSPIFIRRFLHSDLLRKLDINESSRILLVPKFGLEEIEEQFGQSEYGQTKYSPDVLFWMGYLYRYISYTRDTDTTLLFKLFDYKKVHDLYFVYHTQSMEWCVENLLELFGYTENIFDKNWRLREAIRNSGYYTI